MGKQKTKVLHTENAMDYTGGFKALYEYVSTQQDKIESIVVLPRHSKCKTYLEKAGIKVYEIPFVEIRKSIFSLLFYVPCLLINAWKIRSIAKKEKIDVLHSNDLYNLSLSVVKCLYRFQKPLVVHIRLMPSSYPSALYNFWRSIHLKYADALITVSNAVKKNYGTSIKLHLVYDIVPSIEKHPAYQFQCKVEERKPFRFLYLANFTKGKGQELALEAFEQLIKNNSNITLTFAGGTLGRTENSLFKESLVQKIKDKEWHSKIVFEDFVEDVELKMKQYDCVLNFSMAESFSFTSYDALRFGIPLIVSDCGGPAELFENGISGILVKNGNVPEMAQAMERLSKDPELALQFSENSKAYIHALIFESNRFEYLSELFISLSKQNKSYGAH